MGGPTSSICYRQHSSLDHVTTQAPPLRQSRDTFRGILPLDIHPNSQHAVLSLGNTSHLPNYYIRTSKFMHRFHNSPPSVTILTQTNPNHALFPSIVFLQIIFLICGKLLHSIKNIALLSFLPQFLPQSDPFSTFSL
jgi:hypothetical protein